MLVSETFATASERDLLKGEAIALPIAIIAMVVLLGGLVAGGMPLLVAIGGVITTLAVLVGATALGDVSIFSVNVVNMLGIGLGIDYGLLMVNRFREERGHGLDVHDAVVATVTSAGTTVVFSALTVAVAMSGLFVFGVPLLTSFGIAGLSVVLLSMAAAVTLLPATLAAVGGRIKPSVPVPDTEGRFYRLTRWVQQPTRQGRWRRGAAPRPARRALPQRPLRERRRPHAAPLLRGPGHRPHTGRAVPGPRHRPGHRHRRHRRRRPRLRDVARRRLRHRRGGRRIDPARHTARDRPSSTWSPPAPRRASRPPPSSTGSAPSLRRSTPRSAGRRPSSSTSRHKLSARLPLAGAVVVLATLVLLFMMTGSVVVPIKAVLMNIVSLGASFGAMVWIFQDGHLSGLLGFDSVGALDLWMPVLILIFAFGLSMDYEVFLLSRIKEVHDQTGDNDLAVAVGLQRSGRIITSAAALIVVVFAGFAAGEVLAVKQLGVGLAIAVIVDATLVRTLLVPATMKLLGERNWWAPAPLRRFHERYGLHEAPCVPASSGPAVPTAPSRTPATAVAAPAEDLVTQ